MHNVRTTNNWYYVQAFHKVYDGAQYTVVFADSMATAKRKAKSWATSKGIDGDIKLYRNNYVRDAENLVAVGNYVA